MDGRKKKQDEFRWRRFALIPKNEHEELGSILQNFQTMRRFRLRSFKSFLEDQGLGRPCAMRVWRIKLRNGPL